MLPAFDSENIKILCDETDYTAVLCSLIAARGCQNKADFQRAYGENSQLGAPCTLAEMEKAVQRIRAALENGERIAVYGDYDCDGITATALMVSYLQSVGADVFYYIPSRDKEGYGLNIDAVDSLKKLGAQLIVTVDNGIAAHDEITYAKSLDIDTIVTDHHTPRDTLPEAVAVVNPHRADCPSAFKQLAGVGVAFKLICALEEDDGSELLEYYSDLVCLGTIADVVPLVGENRVISAHGLSRLSETERPGITALMEVCGINTAPISGEAVAFGLVPRINAAGRMGSTDDAVELLLTDDVSYAKDLAAGIDANNNLRKETETQIFAEILDIIAENPAILLKRVLLVSGDNWHHGVVGIVAARICEYYGMPTILFSVADGEARGSGRSPEGYSLIEAITACSSHLTRYGGHTLAAGLTLLADKLDNFAENLEVYSKDHVPALPVPAVHIDCVISPHHLTPEIVQSFSLLEPFGAGNPPPLFLLKNLTIEQVLPTADRKHIRIRFSADGASFFAIYFRMCEDDFPYHAGDKTDIVASLSVNEYNGKVGVSVKIKDLRMSDIPQDEILEERERYIRHRFGVYHNGDRERLLPDREHFAAVYRFLRSSGKFTYHNEELYYRLLHEKMGYDRMLVCLDVLEEMGLISRSDEAGCVKVVPTAEKVDIEESGILCGLRS